MPNRYFLAVLALLIAAGCSIFVSEPRNIETGSNVVCILYNDTEFKTAVVETVSKNLRADGYRVAADRVKRAKYYDASDFGAVVYMAEYWMWHTPFHQKSYYNKNDKASNIVFVTTSGDPDVTITEPFDAITSVSKKTEVGRVSNDILARLKGVLRSN